MLDNETNFSNNIIMVDLGLKKYDSIILSFSFVKDRSSINLAIMKISKITDNNIISNVAIDHTDYYQEVRLEIPMSIYLKNQDKIDEIHNETERYSDYKGKPEFS